MGQFTATALQRAESDAARSVEARAEEIEREANHKVAISPGPTAIEDRLALAYGSPAPRAMSDFFIHWRQPPHPRWDKYQERQAARAIAQAAQSAAAVARSRLKESAARLARLEARLAEIEAQHSAVCVALKADPQPMADPLEIGQQEAVKNGCERLLPVLRREIEATRPEPERAEREAANWDVLYNLGEVIAGFMRASDGLARDLGLKEAWQLCDPTTRRMREEERREEAERKQAEALQRELERPERERQSAELAKAAAARRAEDERVDSLDFAGSVSYLFFAGRSFDTLDELNQAAAEWDHRQLGMLKEAVRLWPETPHPDFSIAVSREISGWLERRRLDPAWRPTTEDELINRAARRLELLIHPNPRALGFQGENKL